MADAASSENKNKGPKRLRKNKMLDTSGRAPEVATRAMLKKGIVPNSRESHPTVYVTPPYIVASAGHTEPTYSCQCLTHDVNPLNAAR
jgi:hypothetical protein